ncbi:alpha subunit of ribonucleoside-diphosphate reductase [Sparassis latifolia]
MAASLTSYHSDYAILAGRIEVSRLHKTTQKSFIRLVRKLHNRENMFSVSFYESVLANGDRLDSAIAHARDYDLTYTSIKMLEKTYLLKSGGEVVERPQHAFMRLAVFIHSTDLNVVLRTYLLLSKRHIMHASPALFNAGLKYPQMNSCYILDMQMCSTASFYWSLSDAAVISAYAGGLSIPLHDVPARKMESAPGSLNCGIAPLLRAIDVMSTITEQARGKRPRAATEYLEVWHVENARLQSELVARNLHYGCWILDLFMQRVFNDVTWSLFDPNDVPSLLTTCSDNFELAYEQYEHDNLSAKVVTARDLWFTIVHSQIETGEPFILYKDYVNSKSNQVNVGLIRSANLCTEIVQYASHSEPAVCNLASVILPSFVRSPGVYNFDDLHDAVTVLVQNLNIIVDISWYPTDAARSSAVCHHAVSVGVQGFADCLHRMRMPFESDSARTLNRKIFETIYHAALGASCELARQSGPYDMWTGSPADNGKLQFNLWNTSPGNSWDWDTLCADIKRFGLQNSLLTAVMPTVATSVISDVNESVEPYDSNMFVRRGIRSIQGIDDIPDWIKQVYKTSWEISQHSVIDLAADRGPYICQSQSMSIYMKEPDVPKLSSMHFYAWNRGLKTGMYYLRMRAAAHAIPILARFIQHARAPLRACTTQRLSLLRSPLADMPPF